MKRQGFTLTEMIITMLLVSIAMVATMPVFTIKKKMLMGGGAGGNAAAYKSYSQLCIEAQVAGSESINFDGSGNLTTISGSNCQKAIDYCRYDTGIECSDAKEFALGGNTQQKAAAEKILRASCDKGSMGACQYYVSRCEDGTCDDAGSYNDLTYYLTMLDTTPNLGREKMESLISMSYSTNKGSVRAAVDNTCTTPTNSTACKVKYGNGTTISACNQGDPNACATGYYNNFNRTCGQIKLTWPTAPDNTYYLTYMTAQGVAVAPYNCRFGNTETETIIKSCNAGSNPDCYVGYQRKLNRTCAEVKNSLSGAISGTYKLSYTAGSTPYEDVSCDMSQTTPQTLVRNITNGESGNFVIASSGNLYFELAGGDGGCGSNSTTGSGAYPHLGGKGGFIKGNVYINGAVTVTYKAGKSGPNGGTGWTNGGTRGTAGGTGGGSSGISINGTPYIVAGGGGGAGGDAIGSSQTNSGGGNGGGNTGAGNGVKAVGSTTAPVGGPGGHLTTVTTGGTGGTAGYSGVVGGTGDSAGNGGAGGAGDTYDDGVDTWPGGGGGGGGGGYAGGGGGGGSSSGSNTMNGGGGGGGSSYKHSSLTSVTNTPGGNPNGTVSTMANGMLKIYILNLD